MKFTVTLNGTDENYWHKLGLTQNPFPLIPQAELYAQSMILSKLGADPIPDTDYIRDALKGWSSEFVELCCKMFKKGEIVRFTVSFPEKA